MAFSRSLQYGFICLLTALLLTNIPYTIAQTEEPFEQSIRATAAGTVNVRGDASTQNAAVATLKAGDKVTVLDQVANGEAIKGNSLWYHVQLDDGTDGFIWSGAVSPPVVQQTCIHPREPQTGVLWLALHNKNIPLVTWDPTPHAPHLNIGNTTGNQPLLWSTLVNSKDLNDFLKPFGSFNVIPLIDEQQCVDYGAILDTPQLRLYAVHETPQSSEIGFINVKDVSRVREATPDEIETLNHAEAIVKETQRFTDQPDKDDFLDEKILYIGVLPNSISANRLGGIRRLFFSPIHLGGVFRLTDNPDSAWDENNTTWTSDGSQIVFDYNPSEYNTALEFFDFRTQQRTKHIFPNGEEIGGPAFSYDNRQLALLYMHIVPFTQAEQEQIIVGPPNLEDIVSRNTSLIYEEGSRPGLCLFCVSSLKWSPSNNLITFTKQVSQNGWEIWVTATDGSKTYKVGNGYGASWSSDGRYLIFTDFIGSKASGYRSKIYRSDSDGQNQTLLTPTSIPAVYGCDAIWSPDSEKIAFCNAKADEKFNSVFVMDKDGGNWQQLTTNLDVSGITWSPDGKRIAFAARQLDASTDYEAIYTMDVNGANQQLLIDGIDYSSNLAWLPILK